MNCGDESTDRGLVVLGSEGAIISSSIFTFSSFTVVALKHAVWGATAVLSNRLSPHRCHRLQAEGLRSIVSEIVAEAAGRLQAIQVDVTVYPHIAERFKVRIIPTLLLFNDSVPVKFVVGLVPSRFILQTMRRGLGAVSKHGDPCRFLQIDRAP
jgi:Thioredoxin